MRAKVSSRLPSACGGRSRKVREEPAGKPDDAVSRVGWRSHRRLLLVALAAKAWRDTMAEPIVRRARRSRCRNCRRVRRRCGSRCCPTSTLPVPTCRPSRLARIVAQVNALRPDLVLIAGDLVSDKGIATRHYSTRRGDRAARRSSRPRLATFAVPGNHDHWRDIAGAGRELSAHRHRACWLNEARPLRPAGRSAGSTTTTRDTPTCPRRLRAMAALGGAPVVLSHSPDPFPRLAARDRV